MKKFINSIMVLFRENRRYIAEKNWQLLRYLTLLYLACLLIYLLLVCIPQQVKSQTYAILSAIAAQSVFSACIWLQKKPPRSHIVVNAYLSVFSFFIMALAVFIGTVSFPETSALLFPLMLIMQTQFYSLSPYFMLPILTVSPTVFLIVSYIFKPREVFFLDIVSTVVALTIALIAYYTMLRYKTEAFEKQKELNHICSIDPLTKVRNKMSFSNIYYATSEMPDISSVAIVMIDLDNFKKINDVFGHVFGDRVLLSIGNALEPSFSASGIGTVAGRFGGDEFMILLTEKKPGRLSDTVVSNMSRHLLSHVCGIGGEAGCGVTCSIGVVIGPNDGTELRSLMDIADHALYDVKKKGGNGFSIVRRSKTVKTVH